MNSKIKSNRFDMLNNLLNAEKYEIDSSMALLTLENNLTDYLFSFDSYGESLEPYGELIGGAIKGAGKALGATAKGVVKAPGAVIKGAKVATSATKTAVGGTKASVNKLENTKTVQFIKRCITKFISMMQNLIKSLFNAEKHAAKIASNIKEALATREPIQDFDKLPPVISTISRSGLQKDLGQEGNVLPQSNGKEPPLFQLLMTMIMPSGEDAGEDSSGGSFRQQLSFGSDEELKKSLDAIATVNKGPFVNPNAAKRWKAKSYTNFKSDKEFGQMVKEKFSVGYDAKNEKQVNNKNKIQYVKNPTVGKIQTADNKAFEHLVVNLQDLQMILFSFGTVKFNDLLNREIKMLEKAQHDVEKLNKVNINGATAQSKTEAKDSATNSNGLMQADTAMESFSYKNQRILEEMNAFGELFKSKDDSNNSPKVPARAGTTQPSNNSSSRQDRVDELNKDMDNYKDNKNELNKEIKDLTDKNTKETDFSKIDGQGLYKELNYLKEFFINYSHCIHQVANTYNASLMAICNTAQKGLNDFFKITQSVK